MRETDNDRFVKTYSPVIKQFLNAIPFNKFVGIEVDSFTPESVTLKLPWQEHLIGNAIQKILHGGVISTMLDTTGGAVAAIGLIDKHRDDDIKDLQKKLSRLGTVDMRVDYLRPGRGTSFTSTAVILRLGNKVAVTRMEMHNETGELIAAGMGTYLFG